MERGGHFPVSLDANDWVVSKWEKYTNKQTKKTEEKEKKRKPDFCWMTSRDAGSAKISREVGLGGAIKQERKEQ